MTPIPPALVAAHLLASNEIRHWLTTERLRVLALELSEKATDLRAMGEKPEAAVADLLQSIIERLVGILEASVVDISSMTAYERATMAPTTLDFAPFPEYRRPDDPESLTVDAP